MDVTLRNLHELDAQCKRAPDGVHALRKWVAAVVIPYVRSLKTSARAPFLDVLQHWLEIGLIRTPVALQRTGFFVALEKHESKLLEKTKEPALACTLEPYLPADDRTCAVCGCTCSIDFNDVMNQWVFTDAVRIHSKEIAHAECAAEEGLLEPRM